jgi:alanyl-tRNA synthetase
VGYDFTEHEASILRYRPVKQKGGTIFQIVLDKTPFYAEMGGQTGDRGVLTNKAETVDVIDTKNENGLIVHIAKHLPNHPESPVIARVDMDKRRASEANHTATHLLDGALREVLGKHVEQKGSLVSPEGIRFDFSHFQKITDEELRRVERLVNEKIREDLPLQEYRELPIEEARKLGAIALFGEKYGDKVRVVQFGRSVEFCGGVHAASTGRIGMFKIISESSIAAGIRRIEARTGRAVEEMLYDFQDTISTLKNIFQGSSVEIAAKKAIEENSSLKKQIEELIREKAARIKDKLVEQAIEIEGIRVVSTVMPASAALVKDITFGIRAEYPKSTIIVIGSHENGKPMITVSVSDDLTSRFNAGQMVREAAKLIQGGGGGQPHFATAGGKNSEGLHAAVEAVKETVAVTPAS